MGEIVPSKVNATVEVDLSRFVGDIRREWESLREHDGTYQLFMGASVVYMLLVTCLCT